MSISAFKYPDRFGLKSVTEETFWSALQYRKDNDTYMSVPAGVALSFPPNGTEAEHPYQDLIIYELSNGLKYVLEYSCYVTQYTLGETYHLSAWIRVDDEDGNTVVAKMSVIAGTMNKTVTSLGTPYQDVYFVPGKVRYSTNNPTIVGEEATQVCFGAFYTKNVNQLTPLPLTEENRYALFVNTWYENLWWPCDNDNQYNQRANALVNGGDGSDPTSKGQPKQKPTPSGPGGGDRPGYGPQDGDPIDFPDLPTTSVLSTGFVSAYTPSASELAGLAGELWGNDFFNSISKILNDPFDAIIGFSLLPFAVPAASSATAIKIGNYTADQTAKRVNAQYVAIDGGSFTVPLAWGNFLDFTATKCSIFLPFVGIVSVNIDDVMGQTIAVQYNIDVLTGAGVACVKCGQSVMYTYPVNVAYDVPLTGSNKAAFYTGLIQTGMSALTGAVVGGGAGAAMGAVSGAINTATSKQTDVQRSGGLTSCSGIMGEFNCYLILHRPVQSMPDNFNNYKGYTSNITSLLSAVSGYTEVEYINLAIPGATDTELEEIKRLLKEGVLI